MAKLSIPNISSNYASTSQLNNYFQLIEDALNDNVLYRNNIEGEPNSMSNDLDMDSNDILNAKSIDTSSLTINGNLVVPTDLAVTTLPDQASNSGKYLTTNGSAASWDWLDVEVFNTIALAKAADLSVGQKVRVYGYTVVGDMEPADYIVVAGGTGTDDGGSYHDMSNGNQLKLLKSEFVDVTVFGAKGDGVTPDDTALANAFAAFDSIVIPAGKTFIKASATPIELAQNQTVIIRGVIESTATGNASIFSIPAGAHGVNIIGERGRLDGPYLVATPAPTGVYPGGNGAIRVLGEYDDVVENLRIDNLEIRGWGDYGIFIENAKNSSIRNCLLTRIGRDGVRSYGCEYLDVTNNKINNISPGLSGNVYGVTFTRRPDNVATPLVVNPPSRKCSAIGNHVSDCTIWKGLDTHGGVDIIFSNNIIENCKIGIGIDEGDTSGGAADAPPTNVIVSDNIIKIGTVTPVEGGINISSTGTSNPATGIKVVNNIIEGFGGTNRGAITVNYTNLAEISGNTIINAVVAGIRFRTECVGVDLSNNHIENLTGTVIAAIVIEDANVEATLHSGLFRRTSGAYTGISLATPNTNKGLKIPSYDNLTWLGAITRFATNAAQRINTFNELTIASGTVTVTGTRHTVDTEGDAASDTLSTINGVYKGMLLTLSAANSSRTVVLSEAGNLRLAGAFSLDNAEDTITFVCVDGVNLYEISRSDNGA